MKVPGPRWPIMFAAAAALMASFAAVADDRAETFVSENANEALAILNDSQVPLEVKKARFRDLVDQVADVPKITRFVLGRYARDADADELAEFSEVFRRYAIGVYESRLGDYAGETLHVTGSTDRKPGDSVVHTEIEGGAQNDDPLPVNWRVLTDEDGVSKVVDVEVFGVWLAINQRDEIVSVIQNNRGRLAAATAALRDALDELDEAAG